MRKKSVRVLLVVGIVFTLGMLGLLGYGFIFPSKTETPQQPATAAFVNLDLAGLTNQVAQSPPSIIYIGRTSCQSCQKAAVDLAAMVAEKDLTIYYYNTEEDRHNKTDAMYAVLDPLGVITVPSVLVVENGEVTALFYTDDVAGELTQFLTENGSEPFTKTNPA